MLPLDPFSTSLQAVANWEHRIRHPDPLDPWAPVRPLREVTIQGWRFAFRRLPSVLVWAELTVEAITGLGVLV
jgi:hypothetical protein